MTSLPESCSKVPVSFIPQVSQLGFFSVLCEINFIYCWKICDVMEFGGGTGLVGFFVFFFKVDAREER